MNTLEMVSIPLSSLQSSVEYWREKVEEYKALNLTEMAEWCEGKASAYENIITNWR